MNVKPSLVKALTTALVAGAASTAFAAANPFEDVPADHWAYDAVSQLAADGVIEGYGDGTYRGEQEITRYEMAQMVARAMAKRPSGADKALVDKLAAEFADELNSLGIRVGALEKKVDNVKWNGTVRYRYYNEIHRWNRDFYDWETGERLPEHFHAQYVTLRLEPEVRINKNWTGHARIDYNTDMNSAKNATNGSIADFGVNEFQVDRMWVQGDYGKTRIMLGKLAYFSNIDHGMMFDHTVSGGQITFGNKVRATLSVGRVNGVYARSDVWQVRWEDPEGDSASYQGFEIYNDRADKITWGVGYHRFVNKAHYKAMYSGNSPVDESKDAANIWEIGLGWRLDKNFLLHGAYAWNTAAAEDGSYGTMNVKRAWSVELDYKGADPAKPGSWGAFIAYRRLGSEAVWAPTYDAILLGQKGVELGIDYVPMKNFQASVKYFIGKDM